MTLAKLLSWPFLTLLGTLIFVGVSGANHLITAREDTIHCQPQKNSSANLWTCYDYYGNEFKDLTITKHGPLNTTTKD